MRRNDAERIDYLATTATATAIAEEMAEEPGLSMQGAVTKLILRGKHAKALYACFEQRPRFHGKNRKRWR